MRVCYRACGSCPTPSPRSIIGQNTGLRTQSWEFESPRGHQLWQADHEVGGSSPSGRATGTGSDHKVIGGSSPLRGDMVVVALPAACLTAVRAGRSMAEQRVIPQLFGLTVASLHVKIKKIELLKHESTGNRGGFSSTG